MNTSKQLDYSKHNASYPKYSFLKLLPQSGSQSVSVLTSGGTEAVFELPGNSVYNLSKSFLSFSFRAATDLNTKYGYAFKNAITCIQQIQFYSRSGVFLCDLNNVQNFTNSVFPVLTSEQDLIGMSNGSDNSGVHSFFQPNNILAATASSKPSYPSRHDDSAPSRSYLEMQYLEQSPAVGNGTVNGDIDWTIKMPLDVIKHTIFALNKDLPLVEIMNIRIAFGPSTKCYLTADQADSVATPVAAVGTCAITNLALYIARQENEILKNELLSVARSPSGMSVLCDWTWSYKQNIGTATSHSVSLKVNAAQGKRLKRIYHVVYDNTESSVNAYDHSQLADDKVKEYYTVLDSKRETDFNIDTSAFDDYMIHQDKIKGSMLMNANIYQYNAVHISDYCDNAKPLWQQEKENQNDVQGIPLDHEINWTYFATTTTSAAYNDYSFVITQRELSINANGMTIV